MHVAARQEGTFSGATRQAILGYERGRIPHPDALRWLAAALGLPFDEVATAARKQRRYRLELRLLASIEGVVSSKSQYGTLDEDVKRRELLALFGRAATAGLVTSALGHQPALASATPVDAGAIEAVTSASRSYRRLWLTTPAEHLREPVLSHLRLMSSLFTSSSSEKDQARLAAAAGDTTVVAAWLAEDVGDLTGAQGHYQQAWRYAERSQDNHLQAYVACCMSEWADGAEAVGLVQRATRLLPRTAPPAAHAWMAAHEARAHAAAHDEPATASALLRADKALDQASGTAEAVWPWMFPANEQEISRYRGYAGVSLELPDMAVPAMTGWLEHLGAAPTKIRAFTQTKLAQAYVQAGDVEQACDLGAQALALATQLGEAWSVMAVRNLRVQLRPMEATPAVKAFDERMLSTLLRLPRSS